MNDVDFDNWYSTWSRQLAKANTAEELVAKLAKAERDARKAAMAHLRAIERTHSMTGCSQARAHARNTTAAAGDYIIALSGAIEIHQLFPEHAKQQAAKMIQ